MSKATSYGLRSGVDTMLVGQFGVWGLVLLINLGRWICYDDLIWPNGRLLIVLGGFALMSFIVGFIDSYSEYKEENNEV